MRGSSPIKTCKTIGEAEKYVRLLQAEGHLIAIRIFFHKLKPTVNPLPKERLVAK